MYLNAVLEKEIVAMRPSQGLLSLKSVRNGEPWRAAWMNEEPILGGGLVINGMQKKKKKKIMKRTVGAGRGVR